ncbi:hypothetical protein L6164_013669 [Bauhinia variegata]|uniref:Uncharacterized protein n=1 Tax=Bauhinia variegata TaxID=167791 RepID=A0ACB9NES7_BAUVA|nr:hypothetical protein L6164_013669 [Bauhinia variegata]
MGRMIDIGRESHRLYHLATPSSSVACTLAECSELLHNHLGHPNLTKLQQLVPNLSCVSFLPSESCQHSKHTPMPPFLVKSIIRLILLFLLFILMYGRRLILSCL